MGTNQVPTLNNCPNVTKKLVKHLRDVFENRVSLDPGSNLLGQWAAYQGGLLKVIEYLEKANKLQTLGPNAFTTTDTNSGIHNDTFNSALESLRASMRNGLPYEPPNDIINNDKE